MRKVIELRGHWAKYWISFIFENNLCTPAQAQPAIGYIRCWELLLFYANLAKCTG
jgi:hypothetical protein